MKFKSLLVAVLTIISIHTFASCPNLDVTWCASTSTDWEDGITRIGDWQWQNYNSSYYAFINYYGKTPGTYWLIFPEQDLRYASSVTIDFSHASRYTGNYSSDQTLWVCTDYTGDATTSTWQQITIPNYNDDPTKWNWKTNSIALDANLISQLGEHTVFAFKYVSSGSNVTAWEIKNVHLTATFNDSCGESGGGGETQQGRLKICAQNLHDYYYNYEGMSIDYSDDAGRAEKTNKIVNMMAFVQADIFAFCEVEPKPIVLAQLADSLNARLSTPGLYVALNDGIDYTPSSDADFSLLKSGFIYRTDRITPVGANISPYGYGQYNYRLRIQTFKEKGTNEKLVISMNHFKAKVGDSTEDVREENANNLITTLTNTTFADPDILILGDLNCLVSETPLQTIISNGFEEQLLLFNVNAYSHCFNGGELIDHVLANESMASQIVNAYVYHNCTGANNCTGYRPASSYSDHDPYIIELNLESGITGNCDPVIDTHLALNGTNGDLGRMTAVHVSGSGAWDYQWKYGAVCGDIGGEDWLITPEYDFTDANSVTLTFSHTIGFGNTANMTKNMTLWVTNYYSSVSSATWTQLTIPTYPTGNNWNYADATVNVPVANVSATTRFAFKCTIPSSANSSCKWEIKDFTITSTCENGGTTDYEEITNNQSPITNHKYINDGLLFIEHNGHLYNSLGIRIN